jgi:cytochrome b561
MTHLSIPILLKFQLYQLYKSIGITVLLTVSLRLFWRLTHRPPVLPEEMPLPERRAAESMHTALYGFMAALPLTGWVLVSVAPYDIPTVLCGLIPWPDLPILSAPADKQTADGLATFITAVWPMGLSSLKMPCPTRVMFSARRRPTRAQYPAS